MLAPRLCVRFAIAILSANAVFPAAGVADPLQPVTKWDLDYGIAQCVAARDYGNSARPTSLSIRPAPNGESYELIVARPGPGPENPEELRGTVDFGIGPIDSWLLRYKTDKGTHDLFVYRLAKSEMAQATSAGHVTFWSAASGATTFSLNSMPALLQGLQACTADLMQYWNQGGENDGRIMEPATGNVRAAFSARDFPQEAMSRQQEGTAQFLLLIDETGAVAGCHVVKTSGIPVFDAMGCQVLRERAKFTPARDGTGKPVRSMVTTPSVTWRLGY